MYMASPFYFTPWKLPLQLRYGSNYSRAYRHFRSNHSGTANILVHVAGLAHIACANFALMHAADGWLPLVHGRPLPLLSALTALGWSYLLAARAHTAPWSVRALACLLVSSAFAARRLWQPLAFSAVAAVEAPLHAAIWRYGDAQAVSAVRSLPAWLLLVCAIAALAYHPFAQGCLRGALSDSVYRLPLMACALCALVHGSVHPFQKRANCYWAAAIAWPLALLTDQPALAFYGSGYIASLVQGVAHEQTGEKANLPELARRTGPEKAGDEHAHTAFFPCLILHSAHESMVAWAKTKAS